MRPATSSTLHIRLTLLTAAMLLLISAVVALAWNAAAPVDAQGNDQAQPSPSPLAERRHHPGL